MPPQNNTLAAPIADCFQEHLPNLAEAIRRIGIDTNAGAFRDTLLQASQAGHTDVTKGLDVIFRTLEAASASTKEQVLDTQQQLRQTNADYNEVQEQLAQSTKNYNDLYQAHTLVDANLTSARSHLREKSTLADQLSAALAAATRAGTPTDSSQPRGRITKDPPAPFDGKEKDAVKRREQYLNWKGHCMITLRQDGHVFNTDERKLLHLIQTSAGPVKETNQSAVDSILQNEGDATLWEWKTAQDMFDALDKQYITINTKLNASLEFDKLTMEKNGVVTPFPNFIALFNTLAEQSGKTKEQKVEQLKKKVSTYIASRFAGMESPPEDVDYDGWVAKGLRFHEAHQEFLHNHGTKSKGSHSSFQQNHTHHHHAPAATPIPAGDPMDLDMLRLSLLTAAERDKRVREGRCFFCRESGHQIWECAKKQAVDAANAASNTYYPPPQMQGYGQQALVPYSSGNQNPVYATANPFQGAQQPSYNNRAPNHTPQRGNSGAGGSRGSGQRGKGAATKKSFSKLRALEAHVQNNGGFIDGDSNTVAAESEVSSQHDEYSEEEGDTSDEGKD